MSFQESEHRGEDEFYSFRDLQYDYPDISESDWRKLAQGIGIEIKYRRIDSSQGLNGRKTLRGLNGIDISSIANAYVLPLADDSITSLSRLAREAKMAVETVRNLAKESGIEPGLYNFIKVPRGEGFNLEQTKIVRQAIAKRKAMQATSEIVPVSKFLRKHKMSTSTLNSMLNEVGLGLRTYYWGSVPGRGLTPNDIDLLQPLVDARDKRLAGERYISENVVIRKLGIGRKNFRMLAKGAGVVGTIRIFRGHEGLAYTQEQVDRIAECYRDFQDKSKIPVALQTLARSAGVRNTTISKLAIEAGVTPKMYSHLANGIRHSRGLMAHEIEEIKQAYEGLEPIRQADKNVVSLAQLGLKANVKAKKIKELVDPTPIEPAMYWFSNGKKSLGLTRDQIKQVSTIYSEFSFDR